jgi:signal transduction histidine kinase
VVSIEPWDDRVRIAVRDHGPGIPDEFKASIFEKFIQVDASDARQRGGTGLGLSIVKLLMARLGGHVGHNAAPDGGTIFHVDLPRGDTRMADCYRLAV